MDRWVCSMHRIDTVVEVSDCLILCYGYRRRFVAVIQKRWYDFDRIKFVVACEYLNELRRRMSHQHTAVFVENRRICLLFQDI